MADAAAARIHAIGLILATVGGFADAGSFVLIGGFTGHITGNSLLTAVYLMQGRYVHAMVSALSVLAFVVGTAAGVAWKHEGMAPIARLRRSLFVEIALIALGLFLFDIGGLVGRALFATAACVSLGLQNGTLDKLGSVSVHSTFITGMSTTLVNAIFKREGEATSVLPKVLACFWIGALAGAFLVDRFGEPGYALALAPLVAALTLAFPTRRRCEAEA